MSNRPFDREIINPLEKPLADDINFAQSYHDMSLRFFLGQYFKDTTGAKRDGFINDGLKVVAASSPDMSVTVSAGLGFQNLVGDTPSAIDSLIGLNDLESYKPIPLFGNLVLTVPTAPVGPATRIDIIEVKADRITTDPTSRQVFNPGAGEFQADTVNKTLQFAVDGRAGFIAAPADSTQPLSYKVGVVGAPGAAPATTPGYIKLAEIAVGSDVVLIDDDNIADSRIDLGSRVSKMQWGAWSGFVPGGVVDDANKQEGGGVNGTNLWTMEWGDGLEGGDILEDIVVVFKKNNATPNQFEARVQILDVDIDTETSVTKNFGYNFSPVGVVTQKIYLVSYRDTGAFPAFLPHVWGVGSTGTTLMEQYGTDGDSIIGTYAIVRRPINKQDS